jgi:hypothetical protein
MSSTYIELPHSGGSSVSGVTSFNGRIGTVTSQAGDYSAVQVSYSNLTSGIPAANVQVAIDYLANKVATSASPGFSFGRSGVVPAGTFLQCESVPSNVAGRWVFITSASITAVFISNQVTGPYNLEVLYHDGNAANLTSLGTITVAALTYGGAYSVAWSVPTGKQLAARISSGSARNVVCGLQLTGTSI